MLEALKGLDIFDPKFYIPVIIGVIILFIVVKVAKKLVKLTLFIAVAALALLIFFNLPSIKVDGSMATLKIKGQEYNIDAKNVKIAKDDTGGRTKVFLVSGSTRIELPFSVDYAQRFIVDKLKGEK